MQKINFLKCFVHQELPEATSVLSETHNRPIKEYNKAECNCRRLFHPLKIKLFRVLSYRDV